VSSVCIANGELLLGVKKVDFALSFLSDPLLHTLQSIAATISRHARPFSTALFGHRVAPVGFLLLVRALYTPSSRCLKDLTRPPFVVQSPTFQIADASEYLQLRSPLSSILLTSGSSGALIDGEGARFIFKWTVSYTAVSMVPLPYRCSTLL
jgi:hypothetical protein